jgi:4-amino-4-deoxy-L-arabinose transferase-like glycosyltransferase
VPPLATPLRVWLLLATAAAAALRLCDLGTWSLWIDEANTFRDATIPLQGEGGLLEQTRAFYPVPFLLLRGLFALGLGQDEGSLRLPFALVGIATVPLLGRWGRRLVGDGGAVVAAWLCALHPWHVFWSQNARGYGLAFLCAAWATHLADRWAERGGVRPLLAALAVLGFGMLCHPTTGSLALGLVVFVLLRRAPRLGPPQWAVLGLVVVAVLFGLPLALVAWSPYEDFLRAKANTSLVHFAQTTAFYYRPILLLAALVGWLAIQTRVGAVRARLFACLAGMPLFALAVVGATVVQTTARYSIGVFPLLLWLGGALAAQLGAAVRGSLAHPPLQQRLAAGLALIALPLEAAAALPGYYFERHGDRGLWREALAAAQAHAGGRPIYVVTVAHPIATYYLQRHRWAEGPEATAAKVQIHQLTSWGVQGLPNRKSNLAADAAPDASPAAVRLHAPGGQNHLRWHAAAAKNWGGRLLVVVTLPELAEFDDGELAPALQRDFDLIQHLPCFVGPKDESLYVYALRPPPPPPPPATGANPPGPGLPGGR